MPLYAETDLIASLRAAQNRDGGWGYHGGSSWTEPTVFALLALAATRSNADGFERGLLWLRSGQRADGGWAPHPSVDESTWVTALAVLVLAEGDAAKELGAAVRWLQRQAGEESALVARIRRLLLGQRLEAGEGTQGWPWLPGTAAWVMPTALTLLALQKVKRRQPAGGLQERIQMGREFLLARTCRDGGWNHGSTRALGYEADSYPETTGVALLALHGTPSPQIPKALAKAEEHLARCRAAQGLSWLRLGLLAHGKKPGAWGDCRLERNHTLDLALPLLARAMEEGGRSVWGLL